MESLLTKLKNIQPNKDFQNRSKQLIFVTSQLETPRLILINQWLNNSFQYKNSFALTLAAIFLILGGLTALTPNSPSLADSLDQDKLTKEAQSLDIQIQLSQAQYYQNSAKNIEVALLETSGKSDSSGAQQKKLEELLNELTL